MSVSEYEQLCAELRLIRDQRLFTLTTETLEEFHPWEHHAVIGVTEKDIAIIPRKVWKQYTRQVRQSSLINAQKEFLVQRVLLLPKLRDQLHESLMQHLLMAPAIKEWSLIQDARFVTIRESVIRNSETERKTPFFHTLRTVTVNGELYYITVQSLKKLRDEIDDKALLAQKKKGMPFLVGSAFEAWSDERAAQFFMNFNPQLAFTPEETLPIFWEKVAEHELAIESDLWRFEYNFYVGLQNPDTSEVYFLLKHDYTDILSNISLTHLRHMPYMDKFRELVKSYTIDSYAYLKPYLLQEPDWDQAEQLVKGIQALHKAFLKESSASPQARQVAKTAYVSEEAYQTFINAVFNLFGSLDPFVKPNDYFLFNYISHTVISMLGETLRYANQEFVYATEVSKSRSAQYYNKGDFIVPVSELSMEQLAEFYVCGRKNRYQKGVDAFVGLIALRGKSESQVYNCSYCDGYHYGIRGEHNKTLQQLSSAGEELYMQELWRANRFFLGQEMLSLAA